MSSTRFRNSGRKCSRSTRITRLARHVEVVLGLERVASQKLRAQVRSHDQHRVLEVNRAALGVGQPAVVHHLQQNVENIRMRLLDFVEENHRIRPAPHGFGQLPAFVVANISRRRANQPGHGVFLHVLAHVDAHHGLLVVEQELGQRPRGLGLAHARRPEEDERADGPLRIAQPRARTANRIGHNGQRRVLPDHALAQPLLPSRRASSLRLRACARQECRSTCSRCWRCLPRQLLPSACARRRSVCARPARHSASSARLRAWAVRHTGSARRARAVPCGSAPRPRSAAPRSSSSIR